MPSTPVPTEITWLEARNYPASVAYMAQAGDVIVVPFSRGIAPADSSTLAGAIRRAGVRSGCPVHAERTGSGSLRIRRALSR